MDLGVFNRRRVVLWCWILVPVLVIGGTEWTLQTCARRAAVSLAHGRSLSRSLIPEAEGRLKTADTLLGCFQLKSKDEGQIVEALTARINEGAHRHGLSIDLMRFQPATAASGGRAPGMVLDLECVGGLAPLLTWMDEIQRPENLLIMEKATLHLERVKPTPVYGMKIQVRFLAF